MVERPGRVQVVVGGQQEVFLDATADVNDAGGEQGLLSIAFAPDYATSGRFYVFYTAADGELVVRAGTRTANPNRGQLDRGRLFTVAHPGADNHNGGQLAFGPDGALYASTGDGGGQGDPGDDAQTPGSLLGKILRVPPGGGPPQVWALGLRNPWRFSFDRVTGDMIIGDVGGSRERGDRLRPQRHARRPQLRLGALRGRPADVPRRHDARPCSTCHAATMRSPA